MAFKFTGKLKVPIVDFATHRLTLLFEPNEDFGQAYDELKSYDKLSLEIKPYRAKRSLDANAYYWVLLTKLAKVLNTSNSELHNSMLRKYGFYEYIDGKLFMTVLPDTDEAQKKILGAEEYHLKPTSDVREGKDGVMYRTYIMLRGSSTYNTEEMARLIDGLITDCKCAGITDSEIASPDERRILKERYGVNIG